MMKVKDLIALLQTHDPEAVVYVNNTQCCEDFSEAETVWPTVETKRDYSKKYNAPDAYQIVDSVRIA